MVTRVRPLMILALIVLLTGCVTVTENEPSDTAAEPTARSEVDGVETWDLTGEPSAEAFGIEEDSLAASYQTDEPRTIVLALAGGDSLRFEAPLISSTRARGAEGDNFTVGARGATVASDVLEDQLRSIVEQLGSSPDLVDPFAAEVAEAPEEQTERVRFSSPSASYDALTINVAANLAPVAGYGRSIIGGAWTS